MKKNIIVPIDNTKQNYVLNVGRIPDGLNVIDVINQFKQTGIFFVEDTESDSLSYDDIRNKLSPFKNLIRMIENGLVKGSVETHDLVLKEIEQCKESIEYLSGDSQTVETEDTVKKVCPRCNDKGWLYDDISGKRLGSCPCHY
jgi:hypothetical protein